jgi:hypothetical protein
MCGSVTYHFNPPVLPSFAMQSNCSNKIHGMLPEWMAEVLYNHYNSPLSNGVELPPCSSPDLLLLYPNEVLSHDLAPTQPLFQPETPKPNIKIKTKFKDSNLVTILTASARSPASPHTCSPSSAPVVPDSPMHHHKEWVVAFCTEAC